MYVVYLDESGSNPDTRIFAVGGWAAHAIVWYQLECQWTRLLQSHGVKQFHMTYCESGYGEFRDWPEDRRRALTKDVMALLANHELNGFAAALLVDDYNALVQNAAKDVIGDHYSLCFQKCVLDLSIKADRLPRGESLYFVVERQDEFAGRLVDLYSKIQHKPTWPNRARLGPLILAGKHEYAMLQAADIVAYEAFKQVHNTVYGSRPMRRSLQVLLQRPFIGEYYTKESFAEMIQQLKGLGKLPATS
jgi:hypothetical protein